MPRNRFIGNLEGRRFDPRSVIAPYGLDGDGLAFDIGNELLGCAG